MPGAFSFPFCCPRKTLRRRERERETHTGRKVADSNYSQRRPVRSLASSSSVRGAAVERSRKITRRRRRRRPPNGFSAVRTLAVSRQSTYCPPARQYCCCWPAGNSYTGRASREAEIELRQRLRVYISSTVLRVTIIYRMRQ